jgi:hypothetical protein
MLPKAVLSFVGRLVGIAAVLASPLAASAAEPAESPATQPSVHRAPTAGASAEKKARKERASEARAKRAKADKLDKADKKRSHRHGHAVEPPKSPRFDATDEVTTERASSKSVPKPSSTPLPSLAAVETKPLVQRVSVKVRGKENENENETPVSGARAHVSRKNESSKECAARRAEPISNKAEPAIVLRAHAIEPLRSPVIRVSSREIPVNVEKKAKHAKPPCLHSPVDVMRGTEEETFSLTKCDGSVAPLAIEEMSILVRPESASKPSLPVAEVAAKSTKSDDVAPGIKKIDERLLERMQTLLDHFAKPQKTPKVFIVSGYRPASKGSFHAMGRAIDFRVEGVENTDLVSFCKTLPDTGCGYYPNSSFIHLDVREPGAGHVAWIDVSGPGDKPEYVASWPPPPKADEEDPVKLLAKLDELQLLPQPASKVETTEEENEDPKGADAKEASEEAPTDDGVKPESAEPKAEPSTPSKPEASVKKKSAHGATAAKPGKTEKNCPEDAEK